ncbi:hypothetical protein BLA39750_01083 [Burkholderia lata]|uniref:Uncharacterized protein n=1 Tax=Burkholderia lata (strain ATCC 17760 / DSM 23089 / LMG 22485 / NCIMB 9086 / R18194 / 383) TaxID=482957 RepID=A0A6P2VKM9_BURL3|nr:hypothetical protein BLA39750_01083 [Burkholderia lata]
MKHKQLLKQAAAYQCCPRHPATDFLPRISQRVWQSFKTNAYPAIARTAKFVATAESVVYFPAPMRQSAQTARLNAER